MFLSTHTVYLNEQKVSILQQAAVLAAQLAVGSLAVEFMLTHKTVFGKRDPATRESPQKPDMQICHDSASSSAKAKRKWVFFAVSLII